MMMMVMMMILIVLGCLRLYVTETPNRSDLNCKEMLLHDEKSQGKEVPE